MKLSIVIPAFNTPELLIKCLELIKENSTTNPRVIVIDNGSKPPLAEAIPLEMGLYTIMDYNKANTGNYPIYEQALRWTGDDVIAYLHSDLFVYEKGWDFRILEAFRSNYKLGLTGFVGSNEIDIMGGRGYGTMSNFQGRKTGQWQGSSAEEHGKRITDLQSAAVLDGCSLIFRKIALQDIGFRADFPPHHFYDRLFSC